MGLIKKLLVASFAFSLASISAAAIVYAELPGNDCSGAFGKGFDNCVISVEQDSTWFELAWSITKYNGDFSLDETNGSEFAAFNGGEIGFTADIESDENETGTWEYTRGEDDPYILYWTAKSSNKYLLFWEVDDQHVEEGGACDVENTFILDCLNKATAVDSGTWFTPEGKQLSHMTFYGVSEAAVIPIPASSWLLGSALLGLIINRRNA